MTEEQLKAIRDAAEKATPGSWWAGECKPADGHALAWLGNWFVDCEGGQRNYVDPSLDAAYIAAAPDLLEALKACQLELHYCAAQLESEGWTTGSTVKKALESGLAAIQKAEGKA